MKNRWKNLNTELDSNSDNSFCDNNSDIFQPHYLLDGGGEIKHVDGKKPDEELENNEKEDIPRTSPVKAKYEDLKSTLVESSDEDIDEVIELSPDELKIDFDKFDTSTLFDDDFEEKEITAKMLSPTQKATDGKRRSDVQIEAPEETTLRSRKVYALKDKAEGDALKTRIFAYKTKPSMVKKKGSSLVLVIAMVIIGIIIISLWLFGYLDFAI